MIRIEAQRGPADAACIVLHGLGASGSDLAPLAGRLWQQDSALWLFPDAAFRSVTINGGMQMRAWYDIRTADIADWHDEEGMGASVAYVGSLIDEQQRAGIAPDRIVLAGFSQGGVISLLAGLGRDRPLGAIVALSCYLPQTEKLLPAAAGSRLTPVFIGAGRQDELIDVRESIRAAELLERRGHPVELRDYPIGHAICPEEVADIGKFLDRKLAAASGGKA